MNPPANNLFTTAQIAQAAGITRQAVHAVLQPIGPAGAVMIQGKDVPGWRFADLPMDWQLEITRRGVKRGFENGEAFLANLPEPWKCPLAWDQVPEHQRDKAVELQKGLARALAMRGTGSAAAGEVELAGLEDFKAEFGYSISPRHWRRLLHRTIERDAGEETWQGLAIYLDDRAFTAPSAKPAAVRNEYQHRELDEVIAALENRQHPTPADRSSSGMPPFAITRARRGSSPIPRKGIRSGGRSRHHWRITCSRRFRSERCAQRKPACAGASMRSSICGGRRAGRPRLCRTTAQ
jgi:hypothetical protein